MTFEEIQKSRKMVLTTRDVSRALGISPERLTCQARENPSFLGFPVIVAGDTVRIPRIAFIQWMLGGAEASECDGGIEEECGDVD